MIRLVARAVLCAVALAGMAFAASAASAPAVKPTGKGGGFSLLVQGRARTPAGPLVNATVTAFGGQASTPVTTNGSGDFTVTVNFPTVNDVARLTVRGTGAQSHIEFVSVPGTYATMSATAVDGTLDRTEDPYVDLDPHTTGVYLAMRAIDPLATAAGWQRAVRSFSPEDALNRTVDIAALADGIATLPAGADTTLEGVATLANAQATEDQLFGPNGGACLTPAICTYVDLVVSPAGLPVRASPLLDQELRAYTPFHAFNLPLYALTLSTGGTGFAVTVQQRAPIVWAPIGDYLRVHRGDDAYLSSSESFTVQGCAGGAQVRTLVGPVAFRVRHIAAPGGGVLLQSSQEVQTSFPDTPACSATTQIAPLISYSRAVPASAVPLAIDDPTGKTLVLEVCASACAAPATTPTGFDNHVSEPHRFDAGGTGLQLRLGRTFTWSLNAGRLDLAYADGHTANITQVSDERAAGNGSAVTRYVDASGIHLLAIGPFAAKDPAAQFGADMDAAAATWDSKINKEYPFASVGTQARNTFGFAFTPDGLGTRIDGSSGIHRWELEAPDRIKHDRFANLASTTVLQRRFWEVIRADGDQYLILESFHPFVPFPASAAPTDRLFVYVRNGNANDSNVPEAPEALVTPGDAGDAAGSAVASGGDFVVIGAPNAAVAGVDGGAVYVYRKPATAGARGAGKDGRWTMKDLTLVATLASPAPTLGDKWGTSVTISPDGSSIAIGAPGAATTGQVAVFDMPPGGWSGGLTPVQTLTPPSIPGVVVQDFGAAIAMTAQGTIAVGAPGSDVGATPGAGIASVYTPNGTGFNAPQQIMPGAAQNGAGFGTSLAASDAMLAIGAPNQDDADGNRDTGEVHAYAAAGAAYNFAATLSEPGLGSIGNKYGSGVAVSGSTILVGAPFADSDRGPDTGAGYLYDGTADILGNKVTARLRPQGIEGDGAGASVGLIDGAAVLGAPFAVREGEAASGAAFVFTRPGNAWSESEVVESQRELGPGAAQRNQRFGAAIAFERDLLVAGSPNRDRATGEDQGEADAFAFDRIFGATFE